MYLEWLCTYWIKAAPTRKDRHEILPLLVLELSSVYEEDEEALLEELENANAILEEADKIRDETGVSRNQGDFMADGADTNRDQRDSMSGGSDDSQDKGAPMSGDTDASRNQTESMSDGLDTSRNQAEFDSYDSNLRAARFSKMLQEKALACLHMYDTCLNQAQELFPIPFQPMEEYMDTIHDYVIERGSFYRKDYDKYLDEKLGSVDWDRLEW